MKKYINKYRNGKAIGTVKEINSEDYASFDEFNEACQSILKNYWKIDKTLFYDISKVPCRDWITEQPKSKQIGDKVTSAISDAVSKVHTIERKNDGIYPHFDEKNNVIHINHYSDRADLIEHCSKSLALMIDLMEEASLRDTIRDMALPAIDLLYMVQAI